MNGSFNFLPNTSSIQRKNSESINAESSDEYHDDISSLNSSAVDIAFQNDQMDIVELLVRELSLQQTMRDCGEN